MAADAGSHFGRQVAYPVRLHQGSPMRAYIGSGDTRDSRGRTYWRVYRLVGAAREYVGPEELTWREAYRLCRRLNREAGLETP
jgi:hypothetical protein